MVYINNDSETKEAVAEQIERCKTCKHCDKAKYPSRGLCKQGLHEYFFGYFNSCPNYKYNILHFLSKKQGHLSKMIMEEYIEEYKELKRRDTFYSRRYSSWASETLF